jgi:hypothetical protein
MIENRIIIRSVYKITRCYMEPARHPITKRFADCVRPCDEHHKIILTEKERSSNTIFVSEEDVIEIFDGKEFDMDNPYDKAWWEAIRYSKKIAQDRAEKNQLGEYIIDGSARRYGTAEFYVERPGYEAKAKNNRKREIHIAKGYIYADTDEALRQKVRLLGNAMPGLPLSDVEDYLVSIAERKPEIITELYTGSDTHLRIFLLDAQDKGIIFVKDKLYYYGDDIILGATDIAVLTFFKNPENKRITNMIKGETYPEFMISQVKTIDSLTDEDMPVKQVKPIKPIKPIEPLNKAS